jgi:hypothetical protein
MCPHCGHAARARSSRKVSGVPGKSSRRKGLFSRKTRRMAPLLLIGAVAASAFLASYLTRAPNTRELEEQELLCKFIENSLEEEYVGELADCQAELSRLKALDHHNKALMETATP